MDGGSFYLIWNIQDYSASDKTASVHFLCRNYFTAAAMATGATPMARLSPG